MDWILSETDLARIYGQPFEPAHLGVAPHLTPGSRAHIEGSLSCVL